MRYFFAILFVLFLINSLSGQEYKSRHCTNEDGLPSSELYHVYQDSDGYLWIASNMGVSRFNGAEFTNFDLEDGLAGNTIFEIYEDYKGRIWFLSFSMKLSYYYNDSIHTYQYNDVIKDYFLKERVFQKCSFYVDEQDNVFFGVTFYNIFKIDSSGHITRILDNFADTLNIYKQGPRYFNLWRRISYNSYRVFNEQHSVVYNLNLQAEQRNINQFVASYKDRLFLTIGNTLFHVRDSLLIGKRTFGKDILWMNLDQTNKLWVGTAGGAYCLNTSDIDKVEDRLFPEKSISSVLRDKEGGYWFTTLKDGMYYVPNLSIKTLTKEQGLYSNKVAVIRKDHDDNLWLGHQEPGISVLRDDGVKHIDFSQYNTEGIEDIVFEPAGNYVDIITWEDLYRYYLNPPYQTQLVEKKHSPNSLIYTNKNTKVLCGTWGINIYKDDQLIYKSCEEDKFCHRISTLYYSELDSTLYLGGLNGFWRFENGQFTHLGENNDLLYYRVVDIAKYKNYLVLATRGGGVIFYNESMVFQVTDKDGLLSNSVNRVIVKGDDIWIGQNKGLSRLTFYEIESKLFDIYNLTIQNGLPDPEIEDLAIKDSVLYVATKQGLSYVNFKRLTKNLMPPPIRIKEVNIGGVDTTVKSAYQLAYQSNFISVSYVGLTYRQAGKLHYRYKMKGLDDSWKHTSRNHKTFTTLPPGDYEFIVQAQNEDGVWSNETASVEFHIEAPFWRKWWFISGVLALIFLLVWLFVQFRISMIRRRNELMQDINEYKQKILRQQMNPHFIFNTLNSIQYFLLDEDTTSSLNYLTKFAKMMRIVLDNSQQTFVPIEDEIRGLNLYLELEALRFEESFDYSIDVADDINTFEYKMPALLLQPYVENSIRHGLLHKRDKGFLKIYIQKKENSLLCVIEDDGVGRKRAEEIKMSKGPMKQSLGSKITEDRITVLNSLYSDEIDVQYVDLTDVNGQPNGTRVEITLPFIF